MALNLKSRDNQHIGKILVVDLGYLGDLLMSTPALTCLRKAYPDASIDLMVAPSSKPVIEHNPDVNRILCCNIKSGSWKATLREANKLSAENYDLAVSFHRAHRTLLMLKASKIKKRVGFTNDGRKLLLTGGIPFQIMRHRTWNHIRLIEKSLSIEVDYNTPSRLEIPQDAIDSFRTSFPAFDLRNQTIITINPNASWQTKRWLRDHFASVIDWLSENGFTPVIIGASHEKPVTDEILEKANCSPINLTGKTSLLELAILLKLSKLIITCDSGPMHMAQALGTPVIAIFGPTDPERCGPWLGKIEPVQADIECSKCYKKFCWHLSCMREIKPEVIIEKVKSCISFCV